MYSRRVWIGGDAEATIERLRVQYEVMSALAGPGEWTDVASRVLAAIAGGFGWHAGVLFEVDETAGQLRAIATWEQAGAQPGCAARLRQSAFARGEAAAGRAWAENRSVWSPDPDGTASVAFPFKTAKAVYGVVQLVSAEPRPPNPAYDETWHALGHQIGLHVERIRAEAALLTAERRFREDLNRQVAERTAALQAEIAERQRIEAELRSGQARLRRLFQSDIIGILVAEMGGQVREANDQFLSMVGYTRGEMEGHQIDWRALTPPEHLTSDEAALRQLRAKGTAAAWSKEYVRRDGTRVPVTIGAALLEDGGDECICFVLDDTHRQRAEEARRASESKLSRLYESDVIGLFVGESGGVIEEANDAFLAMVGHTREEVDAGTLRWDALIADDWRSETPAMAAALIERGFMPGQQREYLHKSGRRVPVFVGGALLDEDKHGIFFVLDITLRRKAEEALSQLNQQLEERVRERTASLQASEARAERTAMALAASESQLRSLAAHLQTVREDERTRLAREIHDVLGQELTGLKMDAAWVARRLAQPEIPRQPLIDRLGSMQKLIDSAITTVRRIATELRPGVLDDLGLVAALEWQAREFERRSGLTVAFSAPANDLVVDGPPATALFRIFQELLTNVARHARAQTVEARLGTCGDQLVLEVCDDGRGITEAERSGSGSLGLVGIRERAAAVGGSSSIAGEPGRGTSARIEVPVHVPRTN